MSGSGASFLLRPKWIAFHLLVFAAVAAMIALAFWQLRRLDERRAFNALVTQQIEQSPTPLEQLLAEAGDDPRSIEWRQTVVSGTFLADQVIWFNRSQDGVAGDNVLSALVTDNAGTVVINRGFIALGAELPSAPVGEVQILARVRFPPERQRGELTDAIDRSEPLTEVRRIDLSQLAAQLPGSVAPVYLDVIDSIPSRRSTDPIPVPAPTLDEGPHLSYAVQWTIFAVCVAIGWVLAIRRSLTSRRRPTLTAATISPASEDSAPQGDAASATPTTETTQPSTR